MRTPPLLADFSHARACKPFCENSLTLPQEDNIEIVWNADVRLIIVQAPPAQFVQQKRGASPDSSKVRYFKKLLLCSSACRL